VPSVALLLSVVGRATPSRSIARSLSNCSRCCKASSSCCCAWMEAECCARCFNSKERNTDNSADTFISSALLVLLMLLLRERLSGIIGRSGRLGMKGEEDGEGEGGACSRDGGGVLLVLMAAPLLVVLGVALWLAGRWRWWAMYTDCIAAALAASAAACAAVTGVALPTTPPPPTPLTAPAAAAAAAASAASLSGSAKKSGLESTASSRDASWVLWRCVC